MRTTPFTLILFFVALNVSLFIINETNVITSNDVAPPYTDPEEIPNLLISFDLTTETLLTGITIAGVGTLIGLIFGNLVNGGLLALVLFALNMLLGTPHGRTYSEKQIGDMLAEAGAVGIERVPVQTPNDSGIIAGTMPTYGS